MSDYKKSWIVLRVWCHQQWQRDDFDIEHVAWEAAARWRKEVRDVTDIFVIEPSGFIHQLQRGSL